MKYEIKNFVKFFNQAFGYLFFLKFKFKFFLFIMFMGIFFLLACGNEKKNQSPKKIHFAMQSAINTLDPAFSADLTSSKMIGELYDTLLEYDYLKRPYVLKPSMLSKMPEFDEKNMKYSFTLRDDLFFVHDKCFGVDEKGQFLNRKVNSVDVKFSFLRIADARIHSSGYWLIRNKIKGIAGFREKSERFSIKKGMGYYDFYDDNISGIQILDDRRFDIYLEKNDPRFLYCLAMPYLSIVPKEALIFYNDDFASHPVGSGPFKLSFWKRRYKIEFERNDFYRKEKFHGSSLPIPNKIVVYNVTQSLTAWLMFLRGELDMSALSKDAFNSVVDDDFNLIPALKNRGIKMSRVPKFQIYYIGFSFTDPLLASNLNLRKAISLAYDVSKREKLFNHCVIPAQGPIPPGCAGYDSKFINRYSSCNIQLAKKFLTKAGFSNGVDPKTGEPLILTFDLGGNSSTDRQLAELFVEDMKNIGIVIKPILNSWPRFLQKNANGEMQLFRVSWIGDYPDAENFLQLFYGPNAGACNRAHYKDSLFNKMYERVVSMSDSPERTRRYKQMSRYLTERCPWIFAYYPTAYQLTHTWVRNHVPHDFCFSNWKYLDFDNLKKINVLKEFEPLSYQELNSSSKKKKITNAILRK